MPRNPNMVARVHNENSNLNRIAKEALALEHFDRMKDDPFSKWAYESLLRFRNQIDNGVAVTDRFAYHTKVAIKKAHTFNSLYNLTKKNANEKVS